MNIGTIETGAPTLATTLAYLAAIVWPLCTIAIVLIFRNQVRTLVDRFVSSGEAKAEIGPVKIELGKLAAEGRDAITRVNRLIELMAESRLLELEITSTMFGPMLSQEHRDKMRSHIEELGKMIAVNPDS